MDHAEAAEVVQAVVNDVVISKVDAVGGDARSAKNG
jgi:hypothetical protein